MAAGYFKNSVGQDCFADEAGRVFVYTAQGWLPIAMANQPPPPPTMAQVPGAALPVMPLFQDLAAKGVEFDRFYPTQPALLKAGHGMSRFYSTGIVAGDASYAVGSEAPLLVRVDFPCTLIAMQGAAFNTDDETDNALPQGVGPRDCWLVSIKSSANDFYTVSPRLASTVVGTGELPGEVGYSGWVFDGGAGCVVGITPLLPNLRIDLTLVMLEQRGQTNFAR